MKRHPSRDDAKDDREGGDSPPSEDKPLGRDERVSLYPLDPAEALRAFLDTPRDQDQH
jgi:hypothetical protein